MTHVWDFPHFEGDMFTPAPGNEEVIIYNPVNMMRMGMGLCHDIDERYDFFEGCYSKWRRRNLPGGAIQHYLAVEPHTHLVNAYVFKMCPGCITSIQDVERSFTSIAKFHHDIHGVLRVPYRLDYFKAMDSDTWKLIMASLKILIREKSKLRVEIWYHKPGMTPVTISNPELDPDTRLRIIKETSRY